MSIKGRIVPYFITKIINMEIVNMTVLFDLNNKIDLWKLVEVLPDAIYNPHTFSGAKIRELQPNYSALVFCSGKVVITGTTSMAKANAAASHLVGMLEDDFDVSFGTLIVKNLVASFHHGRRVDLVEFYNKHKKESSYEIELFPALFYKPKHIKGTITIFSTGRINLTGVRTFEDLLDLEAFIRAELLK